MGYFVVGFICLVIGATIGCVVTGMCKDGASADREKALIMDRDFWRREAKKHAAKLGEIRIAIEKEQMKSNLVAYIQQKL